VSAKRAASCTPRSTRRLSSPNVRGSTTQQAPPIGAAVERVEHRAASDRRLALKVMLPAAAPAMDYPDRR
jgi:hypothetical protein